MAEGTSPLSTQVAGLYPGVAGLAELSAFRQAADVGTRFLKLHERLEEAFRPVRLSVQLPALVDLSMPSVRLPVPDLVPLVPRAQVADWLKGLTPRFDMATTVTPDFQVMLRSPMTPVFDRLEMLAAGVTLPTLTPVPGLEEFARRLAPTPETMERVRLLAARLAEASASGVLAGVPVQVAPERVRSPEAEAILSELQRLGLLHVGLVMVAVAIWRVSGHDAVLAGYLLLLAQAMIDLYKGTAR